MSSESSSFLYIFRGGKDMNQMSPEELQQSMDAWFAWMGELKSKDHLEGGEPLHEGGKVLRGKNGQSITDGPFAEGKEEVGGYLIVTARDLDHAAELATGCPIFQNDGSVEVRPIQKMSADQKAA
jgi:hypothetical protein